MYALLAADAMNSQEYIKSASLFVQARDLCPSGKYPEMDTLSLVRRSTQSLGELIGMF